MASASALIPVSFTNLSASAGSVSLLAPEPTPSSIPPRVPSSPSTVTPNLCAYSTTSAVISTF